MFKSLIGALMVATLTAPTPRINASDETQNISTYISLPTQKENPNGFSYYYENYTKNILYNEDDDEIELKICEYNQATCTQLNGSYYDYYMAGYNGYYYNQYRKITPKTFKWIRINNKRSLNSLTFNFTLHQLHSEIVNSFNPVIKGEIYYTTNTDVNKYYNVVNNTNLDFYDQAKEEITNMMFVSKMADIELTSTNQLTISSPQLSYGVFYILIFLEYITNGTASYSYASANTWTYLNVQTTASNYVINAQTGNPINYEVIDLPSLMFTILTMPFSFVSQAFNLTLFAGTPYMINLSQLFLALIGVLVFMFIIKIFLSR